MERSAIADPLVGRLVDGRYRVETPVARGGMATVYAAKDLRLDRLVALKVMPHTLADDEDFSQRFVREARAAARLTHPNVVAVYDQGDDNGVVFLAMEFVPGKRTLRDVVRDEAPLPPIRALASIEPVLRALAAAHESGIVHRDVKPENVLLGPHGEVKVADFGLARAISSASTATATGGVLMGTVSYLPPELVVDGTADARSDVYSVGVMLFELLTGVKPHVGDSPIQVAYKHVHADVPAPSTIVPGVPGYLDAFVARATARERDLRPADAYVMLQQLRRVRHALEHGVVEDRELTDDLTPTVAVGRSDDGAGAEGLVGRSPQDAVATSVVAVGAPDSTPTALRPAGEHTPGLALTPTPVVGAGTPPPTRGKPATATSRPRRRRRRAWIASVLVLVLAAGAALAGWYYGVGRFQSTPTLVGLSQQQAAAKARAAGLRLEVTGRAYSDKVPAGDLISTDPGPGDHVVKGGVVDAVISQGVHMYQVPRLAGLTEAAAEQRIAAGSLRLGTVRHEWSDAVPAGRLIGFSPKAGTPLRGGSHVDLVVSKGPVPVHIPNYTDKDAGTARTDLSELQFSVHQILRYNNTIPQGDVITQTPDSGTGHHGDTITLVVSKGPHMVQVPSVTGESESNAVSDLHAAGFVVKVRTSFGFGEVIIQSPRAGNMEPYGSTVTIYVD